MEELVSVSGFQVVGTKDIEGNEAIALILHEDDEVWPPFGFRGSAATIRLAENLLQLSLVQSMADDSRSALTAIRDLLNRHLESSN